jgi:hypothetical protein
MNTINQYGIKLWYNDKGQLHRTDGPAVEYDGGSKFWYINDQYHRENGPAIEHYDGTKEWWFNGMRHRKGGPAVEYFNNDKEWFFYGEYIHCKDNEEFLRIVKMKVLL